MRARFYKRVCVHSLRGAATPGWIQMCLLLRELYVMVKTTQDRPAVEKKPELMTVKEAADYMRIPIQTVYYLIKQGVISAVSIGGRYRVKRSWIDREILKTEEGPVIEFAGVIQEGLEAEFDHCIERSPIWMPKLTLVGEPNTLIKSLRDFHPNLRVIAAITEHSLLSEFAKVMTLVQAPFSRELVEGAVRIINTKGGDE